MWVLISPSACDTLQVQLLEANGESAAAGFDTGACVAANTAADGGPDAPQRVGVAWSSWLGDADFREREVVLRLQLRGALYAFGFGR